MKQLAILVALVLVPACASLPSPKELQDAAFATSRALGAAHAAVAALCAEPVAEKDVKPCKAAAEALAVADVAVKLVPKSDEDAGPSK